MKATNLRKNLYATLDKILETGVPVEIDRKGRRLRIVADEPAGRLDRLIPHRIVVGNSDDLVTMDGPALWGEEPLA